MIYSIVAIVVFLLDQATKWLIVSNFELHETRSVIGEFFQITSHRNKGAAFSILQNQRWFFVSITIVIMLGLIIYMRRMIRENKQLLSVALSLILGGALGNFIDRLLTGEVVDFFQFWFRFSIFNWDVNYIFPIFNVADSAIVIGVALIFIDAYRSWLRERKEGINEAHGS